MDRDFSSVTWDEAARSFLLHLKAVRAPKTVIYYRSRLRTLSKWADTHTIPLSAFGKRRLDEYLGERLDDGISRSTLHHDALTAKVFLKWCVRNDLVERSPLVEYAVPRAPKPFKYMPTNEDMQALIAACHTYWDPSENPQVRFLYPARRLFHRDRNYAIIMTLLDSACRIGEVLSFQLDDYQVSARQLNIRESKGKEARAVPVSADCARALSDWLKVRARVMKNVPLADDPGWLFVSESGGHIDAGRFLKTLKKVAAYAKLSKQISLHSLRRYSLNKLAKHNLLAARTIAGHKSANTTLIYTTLDPDFVREMHEQVGVVRGVLNNRRAVAKKRLL